MNELIQSYLFSEFVNNATKEALIQIVKSNHLDPKKFFDRIEGIYESACNVTNINAYIKACVSRLNLDEFKEPVYFFPGWCLGVKWFSWFKDDPVEKSTFASCINYVLKNHLIPGFVWVDDLLETMEDYCKKENIDSWNKAVELLISSNKLKEFNIPADEIKTEIVKTLTDWNDVVQELNCSGGYE